MEVILIDEDDGNEIWMDGRNFCPHAGLRIGPPILSEPVNNDIHMNSRISTSC